MLWLGVAGVLLAVSVWRELLHAAARELGVHDPPNVLLNSLHRPWSSWDCARVGDPVARRRQIDRLMQRTRRLQRGIRELRPPSAG